MTNRSLITDVNINEEFLTCPYDYYDYELHNVSVEYNWKQAVQKTVNNIVRECLSIPSIDRTHGCILKLIGEYWIRLDRQLFDSLQQFFTVSAVIIDHLMGFLMSKEDKGSMDTMTLSNNVNAGDELIMEKVLLEVDEQLLETYCEVATDYFVGNNKEIPSQIEVIDLMNAKRYVRFLT